MLVDFVADTTGRVLATIGVGSDNQNSKPKNHLNLKLENTGNGINFYVS